jgi:hypothetical protein
MGEEPSSIRHPNLTAQQSIVGYASKGDRGGYEMGFLTHAKLPTQEAINAQFTHGKIDKSLAYYNKIKRQGGDYQLGALTEQWYGANTEWQDDIAHEYDAPAQQQIVGYIVGFLTSQPHPTPFTIVWNDGPKSISLSGNTIEIVGYPKPPSEAERKNKNP